MSSERHDEDPELSERRDELYRAALWLVGNADDAEDLVQDSWLEELVHGTSSHRVLRNLAHRLRRARFVRQWHERRFASGRSLEVWPDAERDLERVETLRDVRAAFRRLPRAHRDVLELRYSRGLSVGEVAVRLELPLNTVRSRLVRALGQLRIEAKDSRRRRAPLVLPPLVGRRTRATSGRLVAAVAVTAGVLVTLALAARDARHGRGELPIERAATAVTSPARELAVLEETRRVSAVDPLGPEVQRVEGLVLNAVSMEPVVGVTLHAVEARESDRVGPDGARLLVPADPGPHGEALATSAEDGAFRVIEPVGGWLVASGREWATVAACRAGGTASEEVRVLVAPRASVRGRLVDGSARPVVGVDVRLHFPARVFRDLGPRLRVLASGATSDEDGAFVLEDVPFMPAAVLECVHGQYRSHRIPLPELDAERGRIVLERRPAPAATRTFLVTDAAGHEVPGAVLGSGRVLVRDARAGVFLLDADAEGPVWVAAPGYRPLSVPAEARGGALRLDEPALSLRGRVVRGDGSAYAGVRVTLVDPTVMAVEGMVACVAESISAGQGGNDCETITAADGAFVLNGLADRPYRLRFADARATLLWEQGPFEPGGDEVVAEEPEGWARSVVEGSVLSPEGRALAGADVFAFDTRTSFDSDPPNRSLGVMLMTRAVRTDREGRFRMTDVPRGARLAALDARQRLHVVRVPEDEHEDASIVLEPWVPARLALAEAGSADAFEFRDALGRPLEIFRGGIQFALAERGRFRQDCSSFWHVPERASSVALFLEGEEVGSVPVALASPRPTEILLSW